MNSQQEKSLTAEIHNQRYYSENADNMMMSDKSEGPTQQEIEEYARYLGMDPENTTDNQLLWIAKQGLLEPVPHPWQVLQQPNDDVIYYNALTKERTTQHPLDQNYRQLYC